MLPGKNLRPEDYVEILWRRKWLLVVPFVFVSVTTFIGTQLLPNRFRSEARMLVIPQQVPASFVQPTVTSSLSSRLQAISQQILSRTRLERLIQELNLYEEERRTMIMEDVVELMRRDAAIQIAPGRVRNEQPSSFTVSFAAENARVAMQVTERLASQFISESLQDRTVQADQTTQFLDTQLEESRRLLADHEQKFAAFTQRYSGELPSQVQSGLAVIQSSQTQLQAISQAISSDRDRQMVIDKTIADISAFSAASERVVASQGARGTPEALPSAARQLEAARSALRALQLRLKPEHPDVIRAQRDVRDLELKAAAEELNGPVGVESVTTTSAAAPADLKRIADLQTEREVLDRRIASNQAAEVRLQQVLSDFRRKVEASPSREAEATEMMRDYETLNEQYRSLLGRSQQARIAADLERRQIGEQFRLIDPPRLPTRPISPDRPRLNLMGALTGLAIGLALIALIEYRDTTFRTEDDFALSLALPVLAVVPAMFTRPERRRAKRRRLVAVSATAVAMVSTVAVIVWKIDSIARWVR